MAARWTRNLSAMRSKSCRIAFGVPLEPDENRIRPGRPAATSSAISACSAAIFRSRNVAVRPATSNSTNQSQPEIASAAPSSTTAWRLSGMTIAPFSASARIRQTTPGA